MARAEKISLAACVFLVTASLAAEAQVANTSLGNPQFAGAGFGAPTTLGQATAIGNSLNVVNVGEGNTVIVNADQTNNGNVTATVPTPS